MGIYFSCVWCGAVANIGRASFISLLLLPLPVAGESSWLDFLAERYTLMWFAESSQSALPLAGEVQVNVQDCYLSALRKFGVDEFDAEILFRYAAFAPVALVQSHFTTSLIRDQARGCIAAGGL